MAKRELVQLAHNYRPGKDYIGGYYMSEKLDGMRCWWDGGITRDMLKADVPWANTDKDSRYVADQYATGLWSRYGNVIHAPGKWLDALPLMPLDGELYSKTMLRQDLMKIIKKNLPTFDWFDVEYHVFDLPPLSLIIKDGEISTTNYKKDLKDCASMIKNDNPHIRYLKVVEAMAKLEDNTVLKVHPQTRLPFLAEAADEIALAELDRITDAGGEGLIVRSDSESYHCSRSRSLLKMKKTHDMEGIVTGYITGRKTDLGSKLLGMMGALVLELDGGIRLELSGFTDVERMLGATWEHHIENGTSDLEAVQWAKEHPETTCPDWIEAISFKRGSEVTFRYRGKSKDDVPQEARYWRKKDEK